MPSGTRIDDTYCRMAIPIIEEQLAKAGVRVAAMTFAQLKEGVVSNS